MQLFIFHNFITFWIMNNSPTFSYSLPFDWHILNSVLDPLLRDYLNSIVFKFSRDILCYMLDCIIICCFSLHWHPHWCHHLLGFIISIVILVWHVFNSSLWLWFMPPFFNTHSLDSMHFFTHMWYFSFNIAHLSTYISHIIWCSFSL